MNDDERDLLRDIFGMVDDVNDVMDDRPARFPCPRCGQAQGEREITKMGDTERRYMQTWRCDCQPDAHP